MKNLFFYGIVFLVVSCQATHHVSKVQLSDPNITYAKVKVSIDNNTLGKHSLKGYVSFHRDSLICFKFYGPLSYEVLSGVFSSSFTVFDHINNIKYSNVVDRISGFSGIVFDRKDFKFCLMGQLDSCRMGLSKKNAGILDFQMIQKRNHRFLKIKNKASFTELILSSEVKQELPKFVGIEFHDKNGITIIDFDIVSITNEQKRCNFGF